MVLLVAAMMLMLDHGGVLVLVLVAGFGKRQLPLSSIRNRYDSADDAALFFSAGCGSESWCCCWSGTKHTSSLYTFHYCSPAVYTVLLQIFFISLAPNEMGMNKLTCHHIYVLFSVLRQI